MAKTVLITGCSSGIGAATARAFLDADWRVWATARDPGDLSALADAGCETARLDVTNARQIERAVDDLVAAEGRIDCLVNNAGYAQYGPLEDVSTADLHEQFNVNVYGPHRLVREVLPHMRERGEGTIVNVSSVSGRIATPGAGAYCGSKFALEAMSDALRQEVGGHGIDVVLVEPGPVETQFDDRAVDEIDDTERSGTYEWLYEAYEDIALVGGNDPVAIPPRFVATTIRDAASATDPAPRYPVGTFARLALLGRYLPDRWRDVAVGLVRRVL